MLSEGYRVREIWETRDNVLGLWSVLGCTMAGVIELLLGEYIPFPRFNTGVFKGCLPALLVLLTLISWTALP
jgi:hypothetical protein